MIQTFPSNTADEPLTYRIRFGYPHRGYDNLDPVWSKNYISDRKLTG